MSTRLTHHEMLDLYRRLMIEIRTRIETTIRPCLKKQTGLDRPIEWEICFLQLRKICELIALGCLVAHGDIDKVHAKALSKKWNPNDIIKEMELLHAQFFPIAAQFKGKKDGSKHFDRAPAGHLTKEGLLDIYGRANDALHSGTLRSLAKRRTVTLDFSEIDLLTKQIIDLLKVHFILPRHGKGGILCLLKDTLNGDDVTVLPFEILSPSGPTGLVMRRTT